MKLLWLALALVLLVAIVMLSVLLRGMSDIESLVIRDVDLSKVPDGTYSGSYHKGRWTYDVEVVVTNHRIVSVRNSNPRMRALAAFNAAIEARIVEEQRIDVDVVSGASLNTKAFQRAVELSLRPIVEPRDSVRAE